MPRKEKQYAKLERADRELRFRVLELLPRVASGVNTGFFIAKQNNPWNGDGVQPSSVGSEVYEDADSIVRLAEDLGITTDTLAAHKILDAFSVANDLTNEHRPGPVRLAAELLSDLKGSGSVD